MIMSKPGATASSQTIEPNPFTREEARRSCMGQGVGVVLALMIAVAPWVAFAEEYECLIEPYVDSHVSSGVPGVIESVEVKRGDRVKKGQVLARLKSGVEQAAYDLAKARSEFATRKLVRNEDLVEEQLISSNEKDEIETEALLSKLELREAREILRLRTIRSPIDGVVAYVTASPGEHVASDEIIRISQLDPLNVEVVLPVAIHGLIRREMTAKVRPEAPFDDVQQEGFAQQDHHLPIDLVGGYEVRGAVVVEALSEAEVSREVQVRGHADGHVAGFLESLGQRDQRAGEDGLECHAELARGARGCVDSARHHSV